MKSDMQLFPVLDGATEAALRASIERHGVLVPVVKDQHGRILDGHHRSRIATELGLRCPTRKVEVRNDDHAAELAGTLNLDRRQISTEQRRRMAGDLRLQGHSLRAIGKVLGVSQEQVRLDTEGVKHLTPETVVGIDGVRQPSRKPARNVEPGDVVTDDEGNERAVTEVEEVDGWAVLHTDDDEALIVNPDKPVAVSKPDLGGGISHPARYSHELLPILQDAVPPERYGRVLDPFAGTGRIHELANETVGVELEPEWAELHPDTVVGSALALDFDDATFDAIVTSPTYGNRFADHHEARDGSTRRSYTHDLGRPLHEENSGAMQWGERYREFHEQAWTEAWRVLRPGGRFVLNIKDHVRNGERQHVAGWHVTLLIAWGMSLVYSVDVETGALRVGTNADARFPEQVFVLDKPGES